MRPAVVLLFVLLFATAGLAQQGISTKRDVNGNLVRDTGLNSTRRLPATNFNGQVNQLAPPSSRTGTTTGNVQGSTR